MLAEYTAYFDASGKKQDGHTVVAGYISSARAWEAFEIDWKLILVRYGVPYFHLLDLRRKEGPFRAAKWKSSRYCAQFSADLTSIIQSCAMASVGCSILHSDFDEINKEYFLDRRFNPYAICGRDCAVRAHLFIRERYSQTALIEYIFEEGDSGGQFLENEMKRSGLPIPIFRPGKPQKNAPERGPTIQLQAADLLAWEVRKYARSKKDRKSLEALKRTEVLWASYPAAEIRRLCFSAGIKRRGQ
jgi:hypothetical protein